MGKCGGCGQFLARAECIRCTKCPGSYHPTCIGVTSTKVAPNWLCPDCKTKIPRKDNSATPVKGPSDGITVSSQPDTTRSSPGTQRAVANQGAVVEQATVEPGIKQTTQPLSQIRTDSGELNVAYEIRCFREELSAMRVELRLFRDEMASLKADVGMCGERMSAIEGKVSHLEQRFEETGPSSYDHLEETISELKLQLNDRDQDLLLNDVMIAGIPELKDESPLHIIKLVSVRLGVNIDDRDIVNVERIGAVRRNFTVAGSEDQGDDSTILRGQEKKCMENITSPSEAAEVSVEQAASVTMLEDMSSNMKQTIVEDISIHTETEPSTSQGYTCLSKDIVKQVDVQPSTSQANPLLSNDVLKRKSRTTG
ncbi:hypothetical protein PYW08_010462 [Mythimna loreyi]|uniref:Uncharacterized protein n=1 Tax=Mythimna loreyi TaxID=667449 RepID=A0ACC2Q752_9NEOP|nr:hypothetical protein PYW08_010462 [Mythimna loreyi]